MRFVYEMIRIMNGVANISRSVAQAWLTGVWLFLIAYFAFHTFQGDSSLAALKHLGVQQLKLEAQAADVAQQKFALEMRVSKMGGGMLDPDLLEELVRGKLGFTHPDEVIVFLN